MIYVCYVLFGISVFFALAGVVGMIRMPDSYCRMQCSTNISTLGILGVIIGGILYSACITHNSEFAIKLAVMGVFYIITNPIAGHAIAKAAYKYGDKMSVESVCDKFGEDMEK